MAIGKRILETLEKRGMERSDLMSKIPNLTPQALSNLIRRDSKRSEWDEAIADALEVSVMWLVYGKEITYAKANVRALGVREPEALPPTIAKAVESLKATSKEGQLVALGRLEEIALRYPATKANHSS